ncbi:MAG: hypothetical protein CVU31_04255 [Betaproteobacteria bacterium HGW-Betaproteobacteria-4]|jgi:hypothetical protein|nr:MAG: hypothetical protein CVU31_04255 [Betaproteobacteria bacterium HGW-Betaproteobacteria-4]
MEDGERPMATRQGSTLFTEQIAAALGRRVTPKKSGRPRKVVDPESTDGKNRFSSGEKRIGQQHINQNE